MKQKRTNQHVRSFPALPAFENQAREAKFLEICTFQENCFPFRAPCEFREKLSPITYPEKIALYLAVTVRH